MKVFVTFVYYMNSGPVNAYAVRFHRWCRLLVILNCPSTTAEKLLSKVSCEFDNMDVDAPLLRKESSFGEKANKTKQDRKKRTTPLIESLIACLRLWLGWLDRFFSRLKAQVYRVLIRL